MSRRPKVAMDFLKPNSTASSHTIPEESVTCIVVKKYRHQNIMSSVVLNKGIEELWASERVARSSIGTKRLRGNVTQSRQSWRSEIV